LDTTEPIIVVPVGGRIIVAVGSAAIVVVVVPRAASQRPVLRGLSPTKDCRAEHIRPQPLCISMLRVPNPRMN
jgi:hypothetical protein